MRVEWRRDGRKVSMIDVLAWMFFIGLASRFVCICDSTVITTVVNA